MLFSKDYTSLWNVFSDYFGKTIFHPQYFVRKYAWEPVEWAKNEAYGILLDIGCGRMPYRSKILPHVKKYISLDHPETAKFYKGKYKPDIYADAAKIPLKNNSIDTIIMFMVLEHLPAPQKALKEVRRILKPKGVFILSTVQLYPLHSKPFDFFRFTKYGLMELLKKSGFKVKKIKSHGSFWVFWGQSLNIYFFKTLKFLTKTKRTTLLVILVITLTPIFYAISLFSNICSFILSIFVNDDKSDFNISHTVLAEIQK